MSDVGEKTIILDDHQIAYLKQLLVLDRVEKETNHIGTDYEWEDMEFYINDLLERLEGEG